MQTWTALTSDRWPPALCARALAASRYAWLRLRPVARRLTFSQVVSCVASSYLACSANVDSLCHLCRMRQTRQTSKFLCALCGKDGEQA